MKSRMRKTISQKGKKALSIIMTLCLMLALGFTTAMPARADDKQQELEARKNALQEQLDAALAELDAIQANKESEEQEKAALQNKANIIAEQISVISQQVDDTKNAITAKQEEIDQKQSEIEAKQAEIDDRWEDFKERMVAMQQMNDGGSIALLSMATNLYELLTFNETLTDIMNQDNQVLADMEQAQTELIAQKQELENARAELEAQQASLQEQQEQLDAKKGELAESIQQKDASISAAEAAADAQQAEIDAKQAEFDAAADELDSYLRSLIQQMQTNYTDAPISCSLNFICPLNSYKYISCQYGQNGHKGVDFAAPANTEIHSISAGVVTVAGWHYSYGNYVMVYHGTDDSGNTYASLYAHMISSPSVSVGESVSAGQTLGYVGSTGNSTGNHLHLELRINGARTNPLNYVPHWRVAA